MFYKLTRQGNRDCEIGIYKIRETPQKFIFSQKECFSDSDCRATKGKDIVLQKDHWGDNAWFTFENRIYTYLQRAGIPYLFEPYALPITLRSESQEQVLHTTLPSEISREDTPVKENQLQLRID
jgi:hypothetical protein